MKRRIPGMRQIQRGLARCCRVLAVFAVTAKLLVPVGYMPAAFADGGPIMLCGSGLPAGFVTQHAQVEAGHDHAEPAHIHDAAVHETATHETPNAATDESPASDHPEWERCSLGGLAGLAAITYEWDFDLLAGAYRSISQPKTLSVTSGSVLGFRSRAPPVVAT
jgi:hypothetical protein